jgi:hypothetical protein
LAAAAICHMTSSAGSDATLTTCFPIFPPAMTLRKASGSDSIPSVCVSGHLTVRVGGEERASEEASERDVQGG